MRRVIITTICIAVLAIAGPMRLESVPAEVDGSHLIRKQLNYVPGELLVQYRSTVSESYAATNVIGKSHSFLKALPRLDRRKGPMAVVQLKGKATVEQAIKQFKNDPDVEYVQPNYIYRAAVVPNDPQYGQLWGLKHTNQMVAGGTYGNNPPGASHVGKDIDAEKAWDLVTDCSSVTVAVIDSGVNYNHEDLNANMATGSYSCPGGTTGTYGCNFVGDGDNDPMDFNGHGTHVTGTIGAVGNNGKGVTGVCWKARVLAVRVLDEMGSGTTADIVEGLAFAVGTGTGQGKAKVVNMSLGGVAYDAAFYNAITAAQDNDVVVVVAAGNYGMSNFDVPVYPCNYNHDNIICVTAADQNYRRAVFSNYGNTHVDIAAPGTNILSSYAGAPTSLVDSMTGWTVTPDSTWAMKGCFSTKLAGTFDLLLLPGDCDTVLGGAASNAYPDNLDARIFKEFSVPAGVDALSLGFVSSIDLEADKDYLEGYYASGSTDPFTGGSGLFSYSWEDGGDWYSDQFSLRACLGSTSCSIGFRVRSNDSVGGSGVAIALIGLHGLDIDVHNHYLSENGTSMAAPHVAGVAALVRVRNPNYTYRDVISAILKGGDSAASGSELTYSYINSGKTLNAFGALKYIPQTEGVTVNTP